MRIMRSLKVKTKRMVNKVKSYAKDVIDKCNRLSVEDVARKNPFNKL